LQNAYDHKIRDYISQSHLVGPNGSLTQQIIKGIIPSIIFWVHRNWQNHIGTNYCTRIETSFYILSAINSGVKDIRDVIEKEAKWWFIHCKKSYSFYR
jgi:putative ATPase